MVIVLSGPNDYARYSELSKLVSDFVSEHGDFGLERIDAGDIDFGRLLESVASVPFLTEKKMIILSNTSINKTISERINELLDSVSETTILIINEQKFDKRLNLYKTIKKRTDFREFKEQNEKALTSWLAVEAKARGGELNTNDASYIISRAGTNQMMLSNELDKLLSYNLKIDRKSIDELVYPEPSSSMFQLLDASFSGNKKRTIELYTDQRKQLIEPQAIMGMICWQIHVIAIMKFNDNESVEVVASKAKLNPFVVRKTSNLVSNLSRTKTKELVSRAVALDARLKSESIDADDAVQHFLLTI